jgi:hypothetical protein
LYKKGFVTIFTICVQCSLMKFVPSVLLFLHYWPPPPPPLPFPLLFNIFGRYHFAILLHMYNVFLSYSVPITLSFSPPPSYWSPPQIVSLL